MFPKVKNQMNKVFSLNSILEFYFKNAGHKFDKWSYDPETETITVFNYIKTDPNNLKINLAGTPITELVLVERRIQAKQIKWLTAKINKELSNIKDKDVKQILIDHRHHISLIANNLCPNWNCDNAGCENCPNADETCLML